VLAGLRDRAIIYSLRTSGARVGELMGLRRGDLNVDDRGAWVTGKGNKVRFIRFSAPAWQAIIAYLEARKDKGGVDKLPLFCRHDRAAGVKLLPLTTLSVERIINRLAEAAGVAERFNMTPHSFRHYFATQFLQATGNLALTQDALGHANPSTTRIYAKTTKNNLIDAHKKMFGD
jgi:site-specific recombinase XerD